MFALLAPDYDRVMALWKRLLAVVVIVLGCLGAMSVEAHAWRHRIGGQTPWALAVDSSGNVSAGGACSGFGAHKVDGASGERLWNVALGSGVSFDLGTQSSGNTVVVGEESDRFAVAVYVSATGVELWRTDISGLDPVDPSGSARAVVVDQADDVIAVGTITNLGGGSDLFVVKLDGATGAELWRQSIGSAGAGLAVEVDASGDVVVGGGNVLKFDGATGALVWQAFDDAAHLRLDAAGDVLTSDGFFRLAKLDGATGAELWSQEPFPLVFAGAEDIAVDATGDLVVAGSAKFEPNPNFGLAHPVVLKVGGASGNELWRSHGEGGVPGSFNGVAVLGADIVTAGTLYEKSARPSASVARLDGATGATVWRRGVTGIPGGNPAHNLGYAVEVLPSGNVVASARLNEEGNSQTCALLEFDASTGSIGVVDGRKLLVIDRAGIPTAKRLSAVLKDGVLVAPAPGSADDPTIAGGSLSLVNPTTAESVSFVLPASNWKGLGSPSGAKGYSYKDSGGVHGPCRSVRIASGKVLKAVCQAKVHDISFSLDESSQGTLRVALQLGSARPQCANFGGDVKSDEGTTTPGTTGRFKAVKAEGDGDCAS